MLLRYLSINIIGTPPQQHYFKNPGPRDYKLYEMIYTIREQTFQLS